MGAQGEQFSLSVMFAQLKEAFVAVICRIGFDAALYGLVAAGVVLAVALSLKARGHRYGTPLLAVVRKIALFCFVLGIPGTACLVTQGHLPAVNALQLSPLGLLLFWCLVILHLIMEEMNFQWFNEPPDLAGEGNDAIQDEQEPATVPEIKTPELTTTTSKD